MNQPALRKKMRSVLKNIKTRCTNPRCVRYADYGGRGIKCEWESIDDFWNDMASSYKEGLTLDRINNNGNYSKENCRWTTAKQQNNNSRNCHLIYYRGKGYTFSQFCEKFGLDYYLSRGRRERGWSLTQIIGTPLDKKYRNKLYATS